MPVETISDTDDRSLTALVWRRRACSRHFKRAMGNTASYQVVQYRATTRHKHDRYKIIIYSPFTSTADVLCTGIKDKEEARVICELLELGRDYI